MAGGHWWRGAGDSGSPAADENRRPARRNRRRPGLVGLEGRGRLVQGAPLVQACRRTVVPTRGSRPAGGHRIVSSKRRPLVDTNRGHRGATGCLGQAEWNAKAAKGAEKYQHFFAAFAASAFNRDRIGPDAANVACSAVVDRGGETDL